MSQKDNAYKSGQSDAGQNKGQRDPKSFASDAERKAYEAGHNQGKKK